MTKRKPIRAVLFDLDGTLRVSEPRWDDLFVREAESLGVKVTPERRLDLFRWVQKFWANSEELRYLLDRYGETENFWIAFNAIRLRKLGCDEACVNALAEPLFQRLNSLQDSVADVVPGDVIPTLDRLRREGYILGLLTNRGELSKDYLDEMGLARHLDVTLAAGELGVRKPLPEAFRRAVEALGVEPEETVYVGDNYYTDMLGAANAGLVPVLIDPDGLFSPKGGFVIRKLAELPAVLERLKREANDAQTADRG